MIFETSTAGKQQMRIAFRVEGDFWVAYAAVIDSMKDAVPLGSIRMSIVQDWQAKEIFMALMRDAMTAVIQDVTGKTVVWPEPAGRPAPEHEKLGQA